MLVWKLLVNIYKDNKLCKKTVSNDLNLCCHQDMCSFIQVAGKKTF